MKTFKRISALIGVVLLVGLYIATLVFAITDNPAKMGFLKASIFSTVVIPVMIWAMNFLYNLLSGKGNGKKDRDVEPKFPKQATDINAPLSGKDKAEIKKDGQ